MGPRYPCFADEPHATHAISGNAHSAAASPSPSPQMAAVPEVRKKKKSPATCRATLGQLRPDPIDSGHAALVVALSLSDPTWSTYIHVCRDRYLGHRDHRHRWMDVPQSKKYGPLAPFDCLPSTARTEGLGGCRLPVSQPSNQSRGA